jgi:hypothetical protein
MTQGVRMNYEGTVKNGVFVLRGRKKLPEGASVIVTIKPATPKSRKRSKRSSLADALLKLAGSVKGLPPDFAENHDHYRHGQPKR